MLQTVIETPSYLKAADEAGLTEKEREAIVNTIAANPLAGDLIPGTGGCRKVRFAGRGKGKSGGYRVITYYNDGVIPAILITVFSKGEKANLTQAERNALGEIAKRLVGSIDRKVVNIRR
mgnify:CR=1 FL=1